jgi:hypothetical protein
MPLAIAAGSEERCVIASWFDRIDLQSYDVVAKLRNFDEGAAQRCDLTGVWIQH